jgi:NAD(P)-dependent dehydrogenase (short-subunit alcohol dehydrogenase family)
MINCISPGGVFNNQSKTFVKKYSKINPSKKMANRKDLLGLINFLISDESNYIIGQNVKIDGGHSVW